MLLIVVAALFVVQILGMLAAGIHQGLQVGHDRILMRRADPRNLSTMQGSNVAWCMLVWPAYFANVYAYQKDFNTWQATPK